MAVCCYCKLEKPENEFVKDKTTKTGHTYDCKQCRSANSRKNYDKEKARLRNLKDRDARKEFYSSERGIQCSRKAHLKRNFGLTLEEYDDLANKQHNVCAICYNPEMYYRNKVLSVDHCHETNKIRGLLCNTCNRALGLLKDDVNILMNAINYLKNFKNE